MVDSATDFLPRTLVSLELGGGGGMDVFSAGPVLSHLLFLSKGGAGFKLQVVSFSDLFAHSLVKYSVKSLLPYSKDSSSLVRFYALSLSYKTCQKSF